MVYADKVVIYKLIVNQQEIVVGGECHKVNSAAIRIRVSSIAFIQAGTFNLDVLLVVGILFFTSGFSTLLAAKNVDERTFFFKFTFRFFGLS